MARREVYPELPSTQDRAIELARDGAEEGSVVVAARQTRGRGRGDRRWASPSGGLYLSVILRAPATPTLLPLAVGVEVADAISAEYGVRLRLKWPNDLLAVDGAGTPRKLAGVLVDLVRARDGSEAAAVVGIGVNACGGASGWPPEVATRSVALEALTPGPVALDRLETVVVRAAVTARRALAEPNGDRAVLARVRGLLYGVGEPVTVDGVAAGVVVGVRADGGLEVQGPDGSGTVLAGDVHLGVGR